MCIKYTLNLSFFTNIKKNITTSSLELQNGETVPRKNVLSPATSLLFTSFQILMSVKILVKQFKHQHFQQSLKKMFAQNFNIISSFYIG